MTHKRYLVTGKRQYRWHEPGTVFEAQLDPDAERRAIERGSIEILEEIEVGVGIHYIPERIGRNTRSMERQPEPSASAGVSRKN